MSATSMPSTNFHVDTILSRVTYKMHKIHTGIQYTTHYELLVIVGAEHFTGQLPFTSANQHQSTERTIQDTMQVDS